MREKTLPRSKYSFGGDEFIFVELGEEMDLETNFQVMAITKAIKDRNVPGVISISPANISYMVRFNPDEIDGINLMDELKRIEESITDLSNIDVQSRIIEIPVLFKDPWTHEALMKFRDRHQDLNVTDLEYATKINGCHSTDEFIDLLTQEPYFVTMTSVMPGIPWCFQLVPPGTKRIEVPKYKRPRTFTPDSAFGFGGAFAVIYPIEAAGGYQIFGRSPAPIFDKSQSLPDFSQSMAFLRQGDIIQFRSINRDEYDAIQSAVDNRTFTYHKKNFSFQLGEVLKDIKQFTDTVKRRLYHD